MALIFANSHMLSVLDGMQDETAEHMPMHDEASLGWGFSLECMHVNVI